MGEVLTSTPSIDGVAIYPLRQIKDERGMVMHMLRGDAAHFEKFGEIYFSVVLPGVVKAWKLHKEMVLNFAVPQGEIKLVIYDGRPDSPTHGVVQEIVTGIDRYGLIRIPNGVWYGFRGEAETSSMIANCATLPHTPGESEQIDMHSTTIPYKWQTD